MTPCQCTKRHAPDPGPHIQVHHILPKALGGPDTKANRVPLCGTVHDLTHSALNLAVRLKRRPTAREYAAAGIRSRYARALAEEALYRYREMHGMNEFPTRYTLAHYPEAP